MNTPLTVVAFPHSGGEWFMERLRGWDLGLPVSCEPALVVSEGVGGYDPPEGPTIVVMDDLTRVARAWWAADPSGYNKYVKFKTALKHRMTKWQDHWWQMAGRYPDRIRVVTCHAVENYPELIIPRIERIIANCTKL